MKHLLYFIFGQKAQGESIPEPTFRSLIPVDRPSEGDWINLYKFGSRYGYRGSFYENTLNKVARLN